MAGGDEISKTGGRVNRCLERLFYWWGCIVASNPWKVILATLVITGLGALGLSAARLGALVPKYRSSSVRGDRALRPQ